MSASLRGKEALPAGIVWVGKDVGLSVAEFLHPSYGGADVAVYP